MYSKAGILGFRANAMEYLITVKGTTAAATDENSDIINVTVLMLD
jgi:hypothetical protein